MDECQKKKYIDRATAILQLQRIREVEKRSGHKRLEKEAYKCLMCGFWHLTKGRGIVNGKSSCCGAPLVEDSSGDKICRWCGTIQDNYPESEKQEGQDGDKKRA